MKACEMINNNLIDRKNIDRKKITFKERQKRFISNSHNIFYDPELIIIKNDSGKYVFNQLAAYLCGDYKEKGIRRIGGVTYPYYVLTLSLITCGCHFGMWEYYENIPDDFVDIETMEDDFENFRQRLETLFS